MEESKSTDFMMEEKKAGQNGIQEDKGGGEETAEKGEEEKKPEIPPVPYLQLFRYTSGKEKLMLLVGLLASLASGLSLPFFVILYGRMTKAMVNSGGGDFCNNDTISNSNATASQPVELNDDKFMYEIKFFSQWLATLGLAMLAFNYIFVSFFNIVSENVVNRVRKEYLKSLLRQNIGWYDTVQEKNFVSRITEDLVKIQDATGEKVGLCVFFMATCLLSVGNAFWHGWKLTLVVLTSAPVIAIAQGIVAKVQTKLAANEQSSYAKAGNVAEEALANVKTVMAFGGYEKEIKRYENGLTVAKAAAKKRGAVSAFGLGLTWLIIWCSYAIAFWYGTKLILDGRRDYCEEGKDPEYTAEVLIVVLFSVMMGAFNWGQSASYLETFAIGRGSAAVIYSVIDRTPEIDSYSEEGKKPSGRSKGKISFQKVRFQYPSRSQVPILRGLSLEVSSGQTVALVGHSGCGKSTVLQLLQRFYDPVEGAVKVDGEDIRGLHLGWLRSQIGVVSQEPVLFNTTILENIQYGRDDVTQKEVEEACRQSNAHGFISKLPMGYQTIVGDRGAQLSGGQKQRVAIARALVRNPAILLLDEATSALDTQSESIVQAALDKARQGRTTLIVAHRLSTIRGADLVVAINEGVVEEKGTHEELLALKGLYNSLVTAQMAGSGENIDNDDEDVAGRQRLSRNRLKQSLAVLDNEDVFAMEDIDDDDEGDGDVAEHQRLLEKSLAKSSKRSLAALDDEEVLANDPVVSEELMDENKLAKEAPILRLMKMNMPEKFLIAVGIVFSIIQGALMPLYAILFGEFLKILSMPEDEAKTKSNEYALWFVALGVGAGSSMFLPMYTFSLAGEALTTRLRVMTFNAMLKQDLAWHDDPNNNTGALCTRLSGDCASVQGATGSRIGSLVQSIATIAIAFGLSLYYSAKLGAVGLLFCPFVVLATFFQLKFLTGQSLGEKKAADNASKIAVQAVANIRTVAALCKERDFVEMYQAQLAPMHKNVMKLSHLRGFVFGFAQSMPYFAYSAVMFYGGKLVQDEGLAYEKVFKVGQALIFGTMMVGQTMAFAPNYTNAKIAGARIIQLLDRRPVIASSRGTGHKINNAKGSILFDRVAFSYPTRPTAQILKSLSYGVEPGKSIALVGPSGCGKSTCIQLILRYYDPLSGEVQLDEQDVSKLNVDSLRSQMAIVAQEPALFDRTIGENIAYGDNSRASIPMDEIISAAKQANIHTFIASLPAGYETRVGEMGTQLSGGQKQRVAIARALVSRPKVLLLDEATSALDTESEHVVQQALDAASAGRTSITIAHRLSSIQNVDRILVINQGELYESGTHSELLQKQGLYFRLWNMQGQHGNGNAKS